MHVAPWLLVLLAGLGAQLLKFVLYGLANRRLSLRILVTPNGLPSVYAVTFACLATVAGLDRGFRSGPFASCVIFAIIVLHDAIRVSGSVDRGGRTALLVAHSLKPDATGQGWVERVRPLLGDRRHRPLHVAVGTVLGILLGMGWRGAG